MVGVTLGVFPFNGDEGFVGFSDIELNEKRFSSEHFQVMEFVAETEDSAGDVDAVEVLDELFVGDREDSIIYTYCGSHSLL